MDGIKLTPITELFSAFCVEDVSPWSPSDSDSVERSITLSTSKGDFNQCQEVDAKHCVSTMLRCYVMDLDNISKQYYETTTFSL